MSSSDVVIIESLLCYDEYDVASQLKENIEGGPNEQKEFITYCMEVLASYRIYTKV